MNTEIRDLTAHELDAVSGGEVVKASLVMVETGKGAIVFTTKVTDGVPYSTAIYIPN